MIVLTKTTYLEVFTPPADRFAPPWDNIHLRRLISPGVEEYRTLYRGVGSQLNWVDRLVMPAEELQALLSDERVEVHLLTVADEPAGYAELDRRTPDQIELAYFGLFPQFVGQGLGKFFLNWTLHQAWSQRPRRVWVHTCDLDHPAALPNYLRAGFQIYDERTVEQYVPGEPR